MNDNFSCLVDELIKFAYIWNHKLVSVIDFNVYHDGTSLDLSSSSSSSKARINDGNSFSSAMILCGNRSAASRGVFRGGAGRPDIILNFNIIKDRFKFYMRLAISVVLG